MNNDNIKMPPYLNAAYEGDDLFTGDQLRAAVQAEREKVAAWMINRSYATGHGDAVEDLLKELDWQIRESEREACAKVCDDEIERWDWDANVANVAINIRARGETK